MEVYVHYEVRHVNDKISVDVTEAFISTNEGKCRLYPFHEDIPGYLQQLIDQLMYVAFWYGKEVERTKVSDDVENVVLEVDLNKLFAKHCPIVEK